MRGTTGFVLWLVAAGVAVAVGLAAVAAIGTDIFGGGRDPLSQSEVDEMLSSRPPPPATTASTSPSRPADAPVVTLGGTVVARCTDDGLVDILSAAPAQGFQVDAEDGSDDHPSVKFESGEQKVEIRLRCVSGTPQADIDYDD